MVKSLFFVFLVFISNTYARCYYSPCNGQVQSGKEVTKSDLKSNFETLKRDLEELEKKYKVLLTNIEKNNKELNIKVSLIKERSIKNKELYFLMKQNVSLQGINNTKESLIKQ
ncbi:hypothetical protein CDJ58_07050 [Campylobacter lari]|nr:hypothetical protein [Campylobacter lari]EAK5749146.1 hypothetical protein [Campylobacter lari]EAK9878340.1 hypothetical protein [Campylobacter lari]